MIELTDKSHSRDRRVARDRGRRSRVPWQAPAQGRIALRKANARPRPRSPRPSGCRSLPPRRGRSRASRRRCTRLERRAMAWQRPHQRVGEQCRGRPRRRDRRRSGMGDSVGTARSVSMSSQWRISVERPSCISADGAAASSSTSPAVPPFAAMIPMLSLRSVKRGGHLVDQEYRARVRSGRHRRVRIAPGWVLTEMARPAIVSRGSRTLTRDIPMGALAPPEEVANIVAFLASGLARHATGTIDINGASYVR